LTTTISSEFIGGFKTGDNINHNLDVLELLYRYFDQGDHHDKRLLCKPIIILLVSIIEAVLEDFHRRVQVHTFEGVLNLPFIVADYIRSKKIDELGKYIASAKKHDLFDARSSNLYERLDQLRRLRNRVHLQNTDDFEPDEFNAFNEKRKMAAEMALEQVMRKMVEKFPRERQYKHVRDFTLPWPSHFP
jgi:hypothetical protein